MDGVDLRIAISVRSNDLVDIKVTDISGQTWFECYGPPKVALSALAEWIMMYKGVH